MSKLVSYVDEKTRQMLFVFHRRRKTNFETNLNKYFWLLVLEKLDRKILQIFFVSWAPDDHSLQDEKEWHWNNETDVMCFPHDNHLFGHFPLLLLLLLLYLFTAMAAHCTVYNFTKFHFTKIKYTLRTSLSCHLPA